MRILFVHQNYPGQFRHLAPALAARGHTVVALTADTNTQKTGITTARYSWKPLSFAAEGFALASTYAEMTRRGEIVSHAAVQLQNRHGFVPDVVMGTPGWGETLFLREVWPQARHVMYGEFYYGPRGPEIGFDPEFSRDDLRTRITAAARQAHLLVALAASDSLLCPTRWQARSFPPEVHNRIAVVHDGIDTNRIRPGRPDSVVDIPGTSLRFTAGDELLTFTNRNLEPSRGYHIFMRALPEIMKRRPKAQVVIIGGDATSYSRPPKTGKSWKETILTEVADRLDGTRVHFVGKMPYATLIGLMQITRAHAYLTYPFVLSWSLLEAMAAGALVVCSRTGPVEEVVSDGVNGRLVDFFDVAAWEDALSEALAEPARFAGMKRAARQTIVDAYDLQSTCLPRAVNFVERGREEAATGA